MRRIGSLLVVSALVVASCSGSDSTPERSSESGAVYAAALIHLVTIDNTFGEDHTFSEYLIQRFIDPAAGSGMGSSLSTTELSDTEMVAIDFAFGQYEYRWIDSPAEWRSADLTPVIDGSVILGVGAVEFDDKGALVPISLWCGGLCGFWATYRMVHEGAEWVFSDYYGMIAMS